MILLLMPVAVTDLEEYDLVLARMCGFMLQSQRAYEGPQLQ